MSQAADPVSEQQRSVPRRPQRAQSPSVLLVCGASRRRRRHDGEGKVCVYQTTCPQPLDRRFFGKGGAVEGGVIEESRCLSTEPQLKGAMNSCVVTIFNSVNSFRFQSKYKAIAEKYAVLSYFYAIEREVLPKVRSLHQGGIRDFVKDLHIVPV